MKDISQILSMISGFGFAVWYAYYMTAIRQPAMEKDHREQILQLEARHEAHISLLMTNFREDLTSMWDTKREDDAKLAGSIDHLAVTIETRGCKYDAARS